MPFSPVPERHGQTDRETDGRIDRMAISISRVCVLTRDKKLWFAPRGFHEFVSHRTAIDIYRQETQPRRSNLCADEIVERYGEIECGEVLQPWRTWFRR